MQFHIVWSCSSIFKLKSSPAQGCGCLKKILLLGQSQTKLDSWLTGSNQVWRTTTLHIFNLERLIVPLLKDLNLLNIHIINSSDCYHFKDRFYSLKVTYHKTYEVRVCILFWPTLRTCWALWRKICKGFLGCFLSLPSLWAFP